MFERNKIDNSASPSNNGGSGVPVEVTLADGGELQGKVVVAAGRSLWDLINGPSTFVEIEPYVGDKMYLAKAAIRGIKMVAVPGAAHLQGRLRELDSFDPHAVLGIKRDATFEDVRAAYHRLVKVYHPDRHAGSDLPQEVRDYLAAVARRINIAFAALEKAHQSARTKPAYQPSTPIYTSSAR